MGGVDLIVQCWTMGEITKEQWQAGHKQLLLLGQIVTPEVRERSADGEFEVIQEQQVKASASAVQGTSLADLNRRIQQAQGSTTGNRLFIKGLSRSKVERALRQLRSNLTLVNDLAEADIILASQNHAAELSAHSSADCEVRSVRSNTFSQIYEMLREIVGADAGSLEDFALNQVEQALEEVTRTKRAVELLPQNAYIRRLQHELAAKHNFRSGSVGKEPRRRVTIHPD